MNKDLQSFGFSDHIQKIDPESPVYPSLMSMMKVDLALSADSEVWMIHEASLPEAIKWVEYDLDLDSLTLISLSGKIQDFGMRIPLAMKKYLRRAPSVHVIQFTDQQIEDTCIVPLLVHAPLIEN